MTALRFGIARFHVEYPGIYLLLDRDAEAQSADGRPLVRALVLEADPADWADRTGTTRLVSETWLLERTTPKDVRPR